MIKFLRLNSIIFILFINLNSTNSQEVVNSFLLKPSFKIDNSWKQKVESFIKFSNGQQTKKQSFNLTMNVNIFCCDNGSLGNIRYNNIYGEQVLYNDQLEEEKYVNKSGEIIANLDSNLYLIDEKDYGQLSDDILILFPPGPIIGFIPPKGKIKIGAKWTSGSLLPLGPKMLKKAKNIYSKTAGSFVLVKIDKNVAYIKWSGQSEGTYKNYTTKLIWERFVEYNITYQRFISNYGNTIIKENNNIYEYSTAIKAIYD